MASLTTEKISNRRNEARIEGVLKMPRLSGRSNSNIDSDIGAVVPIYSIAQSFAHRSSPTLQLMFPL